MKGKLVASLRALKRWYWMPIAVLLLGILSIIMVILTHRIDINQSRNFALSDGLMTMQLKIANFHLWLEEAITGNEELDIKEVWRDIDDAILLGEAILSGGAYHDHLILEPLTDSRLRMQAREIKSLLTEFRVVALQRYKNPKTEGIGSPVDLKFDAIYREIQGKIKALEHVTDRNELRYRARVGRLFQGGLVTWTLIVIIATGGLWIWERKRRAVERALKNANEELQSQKTELEKHREHLMELVDERTAEITTANRDLEQEVAERRLKERELRVSKERIERLSSEFRTLVEAITDPLTLLSPDLKVLWANHSMACGMGREISNLEESYCYARWHRSSAPCEGCSAVKSFQTGKEETMQMEAPDGKIWEMKAFPVKSDDEKVRNVLTVAVDITEKMTLQKETMRTAHLASLGELAAGVAHEINNPITGIINYAQILVDGQRKSEDKGIPQRILKEGNRIAVIVRSLLSFARQRKEEKSPVHIHEILTDTLALSGTQLRKDGILLKTEISDRLPKIIAHSQQIQQVFLNIVNNARYALNEKYPGNDENKILEIRGEEKSIDERPHLAITFYDRGIGIPEDILHKVIHPFFSTKPKALGTGLGLSISHGIISDHGGKLLIESVEREFTEVQILLPCAP